MEFEQQGADRATYGTGLLKRLAVNLRQRGVPGTSPDLLERMRILCALYPQLSESISAPPVRKSSPPVTISGATSERLPSPLGHELVLSLSWTHLIDLLGIEDPWKRAFYENECIKGGCPKPEELERLIEEDRAVWEQRHPQHCAP